MYAMFKNMSSNILKNFDDFANIQI